MVIVAAPSSSSPLLSTGAIVGIAVAGVVAVAGSVAIALNAAKIAAIKKMISTKFTTSKPLYHGGSKKVAIRFGGANEPISQGISTGAPKPFVVNVKSAVPY
jgi:hypothetical protein